MKNSRYVLMVLMLSLVLPAVGDENQVLIEECEACHGPGGVSDQEDIPTVAGKSSADLHEAINQFYFYERHCPTTTYRRGDLPPSPMSMCDIAGRLSDDDIRMLGQYFETGEYTPVEAASE
jgi:cytochrome c553